MADKGCKISLEDTNVTGDMTMWGNREWYGQGQQTTKKAGGLQCMAAFYSGRTQHRTIKE